MNQLTEVTSQKEFEDCIKKGDIAVVRSGIWAAYDSSQVRAYGSSQVTAYGSSQVRAYGSSQVTAYGSSQVTAYNSSQVTACDSSQVRACGSSQVTACGSSQVTAYDSSQVRAYDSSQVRAYDSSQVTAYGYVAVTKQSDRVKTKISKTCKLITVPPITDLKEYLNRYPVSRDKNNVYLYKAVAKDLTSIHSSFKIQYPESGEISNEKLDPPESGSCANGLHFSHFDWAVRFGLNYNEFVILKAKVPKINPRTGKENIIVSPDCDGKVRCGYAEIIEVIIDWQHYNPDK